MSSDPKSRGIPANKTAMQQCALGCAFAALVCVGLALCTGKQHEVPTQSEARLVEPGVAEVSDTSVASTAPPWFTKDEFLTTAALESDPKRTETDISTLLTHRRAWYEFSWPTYDDLPRAVSEGGQSEPMRFRDRPALDSLGLYPRGGGTEYIGMAPVEYQPSFPVFAPYDLESWYLPERWTGPIGLLHELAANSALTHTDISLTDALNCLYLNGFTSIRLDDDTVLAGHGQCVVEFIVAHNLVDACRFIEPREALAKVLATDAMFVAQNGRTAGLSEIDQGRVLSKRSLWGSFPISRGLSTQDWSRAIAYTRAPVSAPNGSKPWVARKTYLTNDILNFEQKDLDDSPVESSTDTSKPLWLLTDRRVGIAHH